ncbi:Putative ammonia monooxygenase [Richelia intracellularis HH01]|uniref:Putative ammonia monooxygenase n=2 Tax=Richelia TaxID=98443 RepID=M1X2G9_9NOST|nr:Putative ammonia monooxygenase [Richelia intracellularis HH01]
MLSSIIGYLLIRNRLCQYSAFSKLVFLLSLELIIAIPLGVILYHFYIGRMAWFIGGAVSGNVVLQFSHLLFHNPQPNHLSRKIGLVLVGITTGFASIHGDLSKNIYTSIPIFVFLTVFLLLCSTAIGYIYSRLSKINILTAILATVPGGVGLMAAIAADYNRNVGLVTFTQTVRVTSVIILIPLLARVYSSSFLDLPIPQNINYYSIQADNLGLLGLLLIVAVICAYVARLFKIPASDFFGPLLVAILFNTTLNSLPFVDYIEFTPPSFIQLISQLLLGINIGEYWGHNFQFGRKNITYAFICVILTLSAGIVSSLLAMYLTSWDWLTCLLVTAPGGSAEIILVALGLNHNVDIITAGHLVRLIIINAFLPLWIFLFRCIDNYSGPRIN